MLMTPTISEGERPPVKREPGWRAGEEEAVGEEVVADTGVGPVATVEGVVLSPGDGEGEDMGLGGWSGVSRRGWLHSATRWEGRLRASHA